MEVLGNGIAGIECATNQAIAFTREIKPIIFNKFLFYYLKCTRAELISLGKGGTQQTISQTVLKEVSFPTPPLNEQKRIIDKVEHLLNKIDEAKRLIDEAKETFQLRRAAILDKAFRGELSAKWRNNNEGTSVKELLDMVKEEQERYYNKNPKNRLYDAVLIIYVNLS